MQKNPLLKLMLRNIGEYFDHLKFGHLFRLGACLAYILQIFGYRYRSVCHWIKYKFIYTQYLHLNITQLLDSVDYSST